MQNLWSLLTEIEVNFSLFWKIWEEYLSRQVASKPIHQDTMQEPSDSISKAVQIFDDDDNYLDCPVYANSFLSESKSSIP